SHDYLGVYVENGQVTVHNTVATHDFVGFIASGNGAKLSVKDCVATSSDFGVDIDGGADVSLSNSTIADNTTGIEVLGGSTLRMTANTITRNTTGVINSSATIHSTGD